MRRVQNRDLARFAGESHSDGRLGRLRIEGEGTRLFDSVVLRSAFAGDLEQLDDPAFSGGDDEMPARIEASDGCLVDRKHLRDPEGSGLPPEHVELRIRAVLVGGLRGVKRSRRVALHRDFGDMRETRGGVVGVGFSARLDLGARVAKLGRQSSQVGQRQQYQHGNDEGRGCYGETRDESRAPDPVAHRRVKRELELVEVRLGFFEPREQSGGLLAGPKRAVRLDRGRPTRGRRQQLDRGRLGLRRWWREGRARFAIP